MVSYVIPKYNSGGPSLLGQSNPAWTENYIKVASRSSQSVSQSVSQSSDNIESVPAFQLPANLLSLQTGQGYLSGSRS